MVEICGDNLRVVSSTQRQPVDYDSCVLAPSHHFRNSFKLTSVEDVESAAYGSVLRNKQVRHVDWENFCNYGAVVRGKDNISKHGRQFLLQRTRAYC